MKPGSGAGLATLAILRWYHLFSCRTDDELSKQPILLPKSIPVYGFVCDVRSGKLIEVEGASAIGKAA
jgi:hypothetical protein